MSQIGPPGPGIAGPPANCLPRVDREVPYGKLRLGVYPPVRQARSMLPTDPCDALISKPEMVATGAEARKPAIKGGNPLAAAAVRDCVVVTKRRAEFGADTRDCTIGCVRIHLGVICAVVAKIEHFPLQERRVEAGARDDDGLGVDDGPGQFGWRALPVPSMVAVQNPSGRFSGITKPLLAVPAEVKVLELLSAEPRAIKPAVRRKVLICIILRGPSSWLISFCWKAVICVAPCRRCFPGRPLKNRLK